MHDDFEPIRLAADEQVARWVAGVRMCLAPGVPLAWLCGVFSLWTLQVATQPNPNSSVTLAKIVGILLSAGLVLLAMTLPFFLIGVLSSARASAKLGRLFEAWMGRPWLVPQDPGAGDRIGFARFDAVTATVVDVSWGVGPAWASWIARWGFSTFGWLLLVFAIVIAATATSPRHIWPVLMMGGLGLAAVFVPRRALGTGRIRVDLDAQPAAVHVWISRSAWPWGRRIAFPPESILAVRPVGADVVLTTMNGRSLRLGPIGATPLAPWHARRVAVALATRLALDVV